MRGHWRLCSQRQCICTADGQWESHFDLTNLTAACFDDSLKLDLIFRYYLNSNSQPWNENSFISVGIINTSKVS